VTLRQSNNSPNGKVKNKVKSMLIIFFGIKRIVHKEFVLAGQTVNSTTVMFCGDCVKMCKDLRWERCMHMEGANPRVMMASRPKVSFDI
jgi:hypothetical protein